MLAYHNDNALKECVVNEMMMHRKADSLLQGYGYWKDGKGCAVGCLVKGNNHAEYESRFGIPRALAYLEDRIFEGLAKEDAQKWPERFLNSITPGSDLSMVASKFLYFILTDKDGILKYAKEKTKVVINNVAALYKRRLNSDEPIRTEWRAAAYAAAYAAAAAADAAYAAAYAAAAAADAAAAAAAAADAAYAAADAAADAAAYAAAAADAAADAYAAADAAYAAAAAADAADAAADAYAAADAAAAAAADAAADAYADADAAYAAADAADAAADAARKKYFSRMADKLIELLKEAK